MSNYRPEIDGLRALAVVPVILFHAGFETFSGGYVGVDVFFVISGYLITSIILADLENKTFSLKYFYERRARRILPALFVMMAFSLVLGWFIMLPDSLENLGQSALATLFFANNVLLWLTSGYWAIATDYKPLVHTWSLGVEEQFYFVWPLLLMYFAIKGFRTLTVLSMVIFSVSIFIAHIGSTEFAEANFYLLPSRAWELMAGALCCICYSPNYGMKGVAQRSSGQRHTIKIPQIFLREVAAVSGLIMIIVAIVSFDENTPFPSFATLLPVFGACLIILFADKRLVAGRILSLRSLVWLGLISYSTYLWHQPLFAFARLWSFEDPSPMVFAVLSVFSLILGAASWKWVEKPFRNSGGVSLRYLCVLSFGGTALLGAIAMFYVLSVGYAPRVFPVNAVGQRENMHIDYNMRVFKTTVDGWDQNDNTRVLVLGDSFGRDVVNILVESGISSSKIAYGVDRLDLCDAEGSRKPSERIDRLEANADVVLLASSGYNSECWDEDRRRLDSFGVREIAVIGPKSFGNSLDAFLRVPFEERASARVVPSKEVVAANEEWKRNVTRANFIDLISLVGDESGLPVFTSSGGLISQDGRHLTKDGARFFSEIFKNEGFIDQWLGVQPSPEQ